jgi:hypothetical protein
MKKLLIGLLALGSISALAGDCKLKLKGDIYYLSGGYAGYGTLTRNIEANTVTDCIDKGTSYLGTELPFQGSDWRGTGKLEVKKVKYVFRQDDRKISGVIE